MIILPKRTSNPSTPGTDKITLFANTNEALAFINDLGTAYQLMYPISGSWTPGVSFGGGTTGITYSVQVGQYVRWGDLVFFQGICVLTSKGSSTGQAYMTGLPVTSKNVTNLYASIALRANALSSITGAFQGFINPNDTKIELGYLGTGTNTNLTDTNFQNTTNLMASGVYQV